MCRSITFINKKNSLLKIAIFFLIKYYIKELIKTNSKNNNIEEDDDDDLF